MRSPAMILIVDADHDIASLLAELLAEEGYGVCVAKTGEQAMTIAARMAPALILLDMHLAGGAGLIERLRAEGAYDGPVVAMSTEAKAAPALGERGATAFLAKPFDIAALLSMVRELLEPLCYASGA